MRNALNKLADGVTDPAEKKVSTLHISPPSAPISDSTELQSGSLAVCQHTQRPFAGGAFASQNRMLTHAVLRD
jgi:hypothetical protein